MALDLKVTVFKYSLRRGNDRMTVMAAVMVAVMVVVMVGVTECATVVVMLPSHAATIVANQVI
jgi:hypothetical protein